MIIKLYTFLLVLLALVFIIRSQNGISQHYYHCMDGCRCKTCIYSMYSMPFSNGQPDSDTRHIYTKDKKEKWLQYCVKTDLGAAPMVSTQPGVDIKTVILKKAFRRYKLTEFGIHVTNMKHLLFSFGEKATLEVYLDMTSRKQMLFKILRSKRPMWIFLYDYISERQPKCKQPVRKVCNKNTNNFLWIKLNTNGHVSMGAGRVPGQKTVLQYQCPGYPAGKPVSEIGVKKYIPSPLNITIYP